MQMWLRAARVGTTMFAGRVCVSCVTTETEAGRERAQVCGTVIETRLDGRGEAERQTRRQLKEISFRG